MDYTNLINNNNGKTSKVGIIGATRGYGYTLLAQIPKVKHMQLRVISSRHTDECLEVLKEIGYDETNIVICGTREQIDQAPEDAILIVSDYRLVMECSCSCWDRELCAWSFFATISSPLVSLSIRCTMPGRITPFMEDSASPQWYIKALTRVPV